VLAAGQTFDSDVLTGSGALILGLPFISSKVMTNPVAARAMIEGMKTSTKAGLSTGAGIITRLMGALFPRQVEVPPREVQRAAIPTATIRGATAGRPAPGFSLVP